MFIKEKTKRKRPEKGTKRTKSFFCWKPFCVKGGKIWLETIEVEERYWEDRGDGFWKAEIVRRKNGEVYTLTVTGTGMFLVLKESNEGNIK